MGKRVCAWCKKDLGYVDFGGISEPAVTHGICKDCIVKFSGRPAGSFREFLDGLGVPVLVIGSEPRVRTGNKYARAMLGKELPEIEGRLGGNVIECIYAKRPGGCGKQAHCKTCTIRITVLETFATGKSFEKVPAYPDVELFGKVRTMSFLISTEKIGDVVLLKIDSAAEKTP